MLAPKVKMEKTGGGFKTTHQEDKEEARSSIQML